MAAAINQPINQLSSPFHHRHQYRRSPASFAAAVTSATRDRIIDLVWLATWPHGRPQTIPRIVIHVTCQAAAAAAAATTAAEGIASSCNGS